MSSEISSDQMEIINEFIVESRDMLDNLEPIIIELGQSCQNADCWATLSCTNTSCHRHGKDLDTPCWLDAGYIGDGKRTCSFGSSEQDCRACLVFRSINGDGDTMNAIFRLFHSMKGSAGFLDLENIAKVAHAAESLLDLIRSGKIQMHPDHVNMLCQSCDFSRAALDHVESHFNDQDMAEQAAAITARLKTAAEQAQAKAAGAGAAAADGPGEEQESATPPAETAPPGLEMLISQEMVERFVQEADELLQNLEQGLLKWADYPEDADIIGALFRDVHSFKGNCGFFSYGDLERLSHQMENLLDVAKSGRDLSPLNPSDLLLTLVDALRQGVAQLTQGGTGQVENLDEHLRQLQELLARAEGSAETGPAEAREPKPPEEPAPEPAVKEAAAPAAGPPTPAPARPEPPKLQAVPAAAGTTAAPAAAKAAVKRQDIRVDLEKLDVLINLIGELVIAENMLIHNPDLAGLEIESFTRAGQQMSKIVRELQELAMNIRMVPVSGLFRRMIRLVHDLASKSGKKIELKLAGEETELDKTVIETITDPLVHLIRNSCDHGLEPPDQRRQAGKPEKGVVKLSARHEEGEVWITIEDDGRGLNREKILAKAISKGLIEGDGSELSDKAVANLIFQPGFSTADQITDVSGRGVGMDVVKQNIDKIKGKIEVTSKEGKGTCLTLRIPLTLGIIDGMMVRVGDTKCIVPTLTIREAFRPLAESITVTPDGLELARVREQFFPVVRLHQVLGKTPGCQELNDGILIVLENQENGICLFVDEILGQQQTVIKGLSDYIGTVQCVSGCTILGDGEVCLILDVGHLVEMMEEQEQAAG